MLRPYIDDHDVVDEIGRSNCFKTMPDETDNRLFYGIELEIYFAGYSENDAYDDMIPTRLYDNLAEDFEDTAVFHSDGHAEIVTIPATMRYHKEVLWQKFIHNSVNNTVSHRHNGMHIHFSSNALSDECRAKVMMFMFENTNSKFLSDVAQRVVTAREDGCSWCKQLSNYRLNEIRASKDPAHSILEYSHNKSIAIHTSHSGTMELRIFASDPTEKGVFQGLEFTDAVIQYCKHNGDILEPMLYESFLEWFSHNNEKYPYLLTHLTELGYVKKEQKKAA